MSGVRVAGLRRAMMSAVTATRTQRATGSTAPSPRTAAATASAPRTPRPGGSLAELVRAARETAGACREAARAAGSAFRAARGGGLPSGERGDEAPGPPGAAAGASAAAGAATDASAPGHGAADAPAGTGSRIGRPYDTGYRPRSVALRRRARDVAELVRAPAALTVPGDVFAGALAVGRPAGGRTLLLAASSVSLYWAGMALNDWADREEDAVERPERPVPSGRIGAVAALGIAAGLTAAGLGLGALAGGRRVLLRRTLPLAAAVWAYDLGLKRTPLGPLAMAAARTLDVLHGTGPAPAAPALRAAATAGLHTWAVTRLSHHEVDGGAGREPLVSLAVTAVSALGVSGVAGAVSGSPDRARRLPGVHDGAGTLPGGAGSVRPARLPSLRGLSAPQRAVPLLASAAYATTCARAQWAALRDPGDPARIRTAVGAGIHALLPLQAALVARSGAPRLAVVLAAGLPQAARLARKVSPT
ncbi:SCO3242 family prenyltransferase [Streptomyces sp. NPDC101151]|uniref:SCO3242 family prenyltransferase n=1 Tax=Streptomyces sp. NPDC101151 TaxID=3366115 RepID=UPI00380C5E47